METRSNWQCVGASVAGSGHLQRNLPCQDAHGCLTLADGTAAVIVADGAGSAARSEEGSKLAVRSCLEFLAERIGITPLDEPGQCTAMLESMLEHARRRLEEFADKEPLGSFASTLLVGLIGNKWTCLVQVGDGGAVVQYRSNALRVLSSVSETEYLNETTFLTASDYLSQAHYATVPSAEIKGLAMFSDGLQMLALNYAENTAHGPFFEPFFQYAEQNEPDVEELKSFLISERVCEQTDDDKTLVLAVRFDPA